MIHAYYRYLIYWFIKQVDVHWDQELFGLIKLTEQLNQVF